MTLATNRFLRLPTRLGIDHPTKTHLMKNIPIETDEWREKVNSAWKRLEKMLPADVIAALVIANKHDKESASLVVYANTCSHVAADLMSLAEAQKAVNTADKPDRN